LFPFLVVTAEEDAPHHVAENDEEDFDEENMPFAPMLPVPEEPTPLRRGKGRKNYKIPFKAKPLDLEEIMFDLLSVCTRQNFTETGSAAVFSFLQRIGEDVPDYATACSVALAASPVRPTRLAVCARECLVDRTNWENLQSQDQQERNCGKCDEPLANCDTLKPSKVSHDHDFV